MLCEIDANQLFFMSEKHVSMANVVFFSHKGGGVGDEVSIFQWETSFLDGRGHPMRNFKKITIELGGGGGMPNQL